MRNHFLHDLRRRNHRIILSGIGIEDCDAIVSVSCADSRIVVVLRHQQIFRCPLIAGDDRGIDDRRRVIPAEAAGDFLLGKIAVEMQHPAAIVVAGEGIF